MRCSPSAALLARGTVRHFASGGCLLSPTPPEADALRLADAMRLACSSRYTEPSEASGGPGGTEGPLRVGALTDVPSPPPPEADDHRLLHDGVAEWLTV